jgi:membrane protease YdiL (CAAX protease family)
MSILLAAAAKSPAEITGLLQITILVFFMGLSVVSVVLFRRVMSCERAEAIHWPVRFGPTDTLLKLFILVFACFVCIGLLAGLIVPLFAGMPKEQGGFIAGVLGTGATFVIMVGVNAVVRPDGTRLIGLSLRDLPRGIWGGLVGIVIVLPWLFWLLTIAEMLMRHFQVHVPTEHEIFKQWKEPGTRESVKVVSIIAAVFIAPFAEELLFRGFLQTALSKLFTPGAIRHERMQAQMPEPPKNDPGGLPFLEYAPLPPLVPTKSARYGAIVVTSLTFALIHQPVFIQPPIFLLSLGLGYVYERTGRLWSSIFMHLFFNAFQFSLFLLTVRYGVH